MTESRYPVRTRNRDRWKPLRNRGRFAVVAALMLLFAAVPAGLQAQTEPEAPVQPEKLYNGWQFSLYGGVNLAHIAGEYYGDCPCDFFSDETSFNTVYGTAINIHIFSDAALYLRFGRNETSTSWFTGRTDSLWSITAEGIIGSDLTFEYNLTNFDVLLRLYGHIDGERVYLGPSFGFVERKHILLTDTEFDTGAQHVIENGDLQLEHDLRVSFVIGGEYAFIPFKNFYVIPAFEVDYSFEKLVNLRDENPSFSWRPTFYKLLVTFAYQVF